MLNRIASSTTTSMMLENLQTSGLSLADIEAQVASGKRISKVSDAPADAVTSMSQRAELGRTQQYVRNANDATDWLNTSDSALQAVISSLQAARTSLVQAGSGALDPTARAALVAQIQSDKATILASANTTRLGRPIFAGTAQTTAAFDTSGNYLGDTGAVTRTVATGVNVQVNQSGESVFGTYNSTDPSSGNVFQLLDSVSAALTNGDTAAISAGLTKIDAATARVENAQVNVGSTTNQVSSLLDQATTATTTLQGGINSLENIDIAEASITLQTRQVAYQAALAASAKIAQPTLLDFLR